MFGLNIQNLNSLNDILSRICFVTWSFQFQLQLCLVIFDKCMNEFVTLKEKQERLRHTKDNQNQSIRKCVYLLAFSLS